MLRRPGFAVISTILVFANAAAFAGERKPLQKGDTAPAVSFVDITGEATGTDAYRDWVQVLTFADRESSEELKLWLRPAQLAATGAHPELRVAYITFADVSAIPRLLRRIVRPILAKTFENSNEDLEEAYREIGVEPDPEKVDMIFAPDWDGAHLEKFGLEDAKAYHCWIVVDGRVVEALDASTPDLEGRYVAAFDAIAADSGAAALSPVAVPVGVSAIRPD